jgi:hypothetical protein
MMKESCFQATRISLLQISPLKMILTTSICIGVRKKTMKCIESSPDNMINISISLLTILPSMEEPILQETISMDSEYQILLLMRISSYTIRPTTTTLTSISVLETALSSPSSWQINRKIELDKKIH